MRIKAIVAIMAQIFSAIQARCSSYKCYLVCNIVGRDRVSKRRFLKLCKMLIGVLLVQL